MGSCCCLPSPEERIDSWGDVAPANYTWSDVCRDRSRAQFPDQWTRQLCDKLDPSVHAGIISSMMAHTLYFQPLVHSARHSSRPWSAADQRNLYVYAWQQNTLRAFASDVPIDAPETLCHLLHAMRIQSSIYVESVVALYKGPPCYTQISSDGCPKWMRGIDGGQLAPDVLASVRIWMILYGHSEDETWSSIASIPAIVATSLMENDARVQDDQLLEWTTNGAFSSIDYDTCCNWMNRFHSRRHWIIWQTLFSRMFPNACLLDHWSTLSKNVPGRFLHDPKTLRFLQSVLMPSSASSSSSTPETKTKTENNETKTSVSDLDELRRAVCLSRDVARLTAKEVEWTDVFHAWVISSRKRFHSFEYFFKNDIPLTPHLFRYCLRQGVPLTPEFVVCLLHTPNRIWQGYLQVLIDLKRLDTVIEKGQTILFYIVNDGLWDLTYDTQWRQALRIKKEQIDMCVKGGANVLKLREDGYSLPSCVQEYLYDDDDFRPSYLTVKPALFTQLRDHCKSHVDAAYARLSPEEQKQYRLCIRYPGRKTTAGLVVHASDSRKPFLEPHSFKTHVFLSC